MTELQDQQGLQVLLEQQDLLDLLDLLEMVLQVAPIALLLAWLRLRQTMD